MPTDTELVESTWAMVKASGADLDDVGMAIYTEMFRRDPEMQNTLFKGVDQRGQSHLLMVMIDGAVGQLNKDPVKLYHDLVKVGERHAGYGVEPRHYPMTGEAVIAVLTERLGPQLMTPDVRAAWENVYGVIQAAMIEGQRMPRGRELAADYRRMHSPQVPWGPIAIGVACVALGLALLKK